MEIDFKTNYSALYDKAPILKTTVSSSKKTMSEEEKSAFISKINESYNIANDLLKILSESYEMHANRHVGDAMVSVSSTMKSIATFKNSLQ
jgi:hypothetical protein